MSINFKPYSPIPTKNLNTRNAVNIIEFYTKSVWMIHRVNLSDMQLLLNDESRNSLEMMFLLFSYGLNIGGIKYCAQSKLWEDHRPVPPVQFMSLSLTWWFVFFILGLFCLYVGAALSGNLRLTDVVSLLEMLFISLSLVSLFSRNKINDAIQCHLILPNLVYNYLTACIIDCVQSSQ